MPIYPFLCTACGHAFDHMTSIAARDKQTPCPSCGSGKTGRQLAAPAVHDGSPKSSARPAPAHSAGCGCCSRRPSCPMNNS